jgi:hypothetical protein
MRTGEPQMTLGRLTPNDGRQGSAGGQRVSGGLSVSGRPVSADSRKNRDTHPKCRQIKAL